jgi:hypothetical protein
MRDCSKTSNLKTKHKLETHFERELNPSLILDFAQCNSKSHPPHPNVNKLHKKPSTITSTITRLVQIMEAFCDVKRIELAKR